MVLSAPRYTGAPPTPVYLMGRVVFAFRQCEASFSTNAGEAVIAVQLYFFKDLMTSSGLHLIMLGWRMQIPPTCRELNQQPSLIATVIDLLLLGTNYTYQACS